MLEYKYKITRLTNLWSCLTMAKVLGGKYYVLFSKIESMRWESKGKQGGLFSKILCLGYLYTQWYRWIHPKYWEIPIYNDYIATCTQYMKVNKASKRNRYKH